MVGRHHRAMKVVVVSGFMLALAESKKVGFSLVLRARV